MKRSKFTEQQIAYAMELTVVGPSDGKESYCPIKKYRHDFCEK